MTARLMLLVMMIGLFIGIWSGDDQPSRGPILIANSPRHTIRADETPQDNSNDPDRAALAERSDSKKR